MAPPPTWTSLLLLLLIHVQVPILAPVRQIDATPVSEDEDEFEDDYDCRTKERKRFFEVRGRENLILFGAFLVVRNLSSIVLELVLDF